jgi:hypothetical protein
MIKFDFVSSCFAYDEVKKHAESSCFKIPIEHKFFIARDDIEFSQTRVDKWRNQVTM